MLKDPAEQKPVKLSDDVTTASVPASKQDVRIKLVYPPHGYASSLLEEELMPWRDVTSDIFEQDFTLKPLLTTERGSTSNLNILDSYGYVSFTKHEHTVMELVDILANKSTCERAKMGAVIVIDDGIFITGYNGTLKGFPNNCDDASLVCTVCNVVVDPVDYEEGEQHCKKGFIEKRPKSNSNVVHAEVNSIYKAAKYGICIKDRPMYMTTSPCVNCANAIVQAGISKVVYKYEHDDLRGLETLRKAGIEVIKYIKNNL